MRAWPSGAVAVSVLADGAARAAVPRTLTLPEASRTSWRPSRYTVRALPSGCSRRLNSAVWTSRCPSLNTMVLSPFLGAEGAASAPLAGAERECGRRGPGPPRSRLGGHVQGWRRPTGPGGQPGTGQRRAGPAGPGHENPHPEREGHRKEEGPGGFLSFVQDKGQRTGRWSGAEGRWWPAGTREKGWGWWWPAGGVRKGEDQGACPTPSEPVAVGVKEQRESASHMRGAWGAGSWRCTLCLRRGPHSFSVCLRRCWRGSRSGLGLRTAWPQVGTRLRLELVLWSRLQQDQRRRRDT